MEYQDIMGLPQVITAKEVEEILAEHVREMAEQVAACIRELNGEKSVSAVFVVGGGGMIPGYTEQLAKALGIVKERVAIRGQEVLQSVEFEMNNPRKDSMMVTPIGICLSYYEQSNNFIFVDFNGKRVKLYDNGKLSVFTKADLAPLSPREVQIKVPENGVSLPVLINGKILKKSMKHAGIDKAWIDRTLQKCGYTRREILFMSVNEQKKAVYITRNSKDGTIAEVENK